MKNLITIVLGLTLVPLTTICLFVFCNYILSLVLPFTLEEITSSGIWYLETIITIFIVIVYFISNPFNAKWD
jgi:hypothetical protein